MPRPTILSAAIALTALAACTGPLETRQAITVDGTTYGIWRDTAPGQGGYFVYYQDQTIPCDGTATGCATALRAAAPAIDARILLERQLDND